jgi:PKD repeat protein
MKKAYSCSSMLLALLLFSACDKNDPAPAQACFTTSPSPVFAGDQVTFDASCSENAASYKWSLGDGTPDYTVNTTSSTTHTYSAPGYYSVSLEVKSGSGSNISVSSSAQVLVVQ